VVVVVLAGAAVLLALGWRPGALGIPAPSDGDRPLTAQERRGEVLYNANCVSCHGANGHTWHHPDCELKQIVREGSDAMTDMMREMMAPPNAPRMQAFKDRLSDDEIDAVLAFIKTLWTPAQREVQAEVTSESCAG